ncbi:hypothetical protein HK101_001466 [Irineochytrium annulatum]|nr:hypothetical protein HK101_001466 [Irineochytrium annulatum]
MNADAPGTAEPFAADGQSADLHDHPIHSARSPIFSMSSSDEVHVPATPHKSIPVAITSSNHTNPTGSASLTNNITGASPHSHLSHVQSPAFKPLRSPASNSLLQPILTSVSSPSAANVASSSPPAVAAPAAPRATPGASAEYKVSPMNQDAAEAGEPEPKAAIQPNVVNSLFSPISRPTHPPPMTPPNPPSPTSMAARLHLVGRRNSTGSKKLSSGSEDVAMEECSTEKSDFVNVELAPPSTAEPTADADVSIDSEKDVNKPVHALTHNVTWSVATEKGYRNVGASDFSSNRLPIHEHLEDVHWPTLDDKEAWSGRVGGTKMVEDFLERQQNGDSQQEVYVADLMSTTRIFVLADGHGGVNAARFFVPRVRQGLEKLISSRPWDFSVAEDRSDLTHQVSSLFRILDAEYCALQVSAYRRWVDAGSPPGARPTDDGCTLMCTILHKDHLVNLNVGDSRTVLMERPVAGTPAAQAAAERGVDGWRSTFFSIDHNMTHPDKVWGIHRAGGHFINPNGTLKYVNVESPSQRQGRPYYELEGARIYRHPTDAVRAVGVSHKRTLNLTATMGDLLFKIEPAVLSPVPDVGFVRLETDREYAMVMATDGIWDHLKVQGDEEKQNGVVMGVVAAAIACWEGECAIAAASSVASGSSSSAAASSSANPSAFASSSSAAVASSSSSAAAAALAANHGGVETNSVSSESTAVSPLQPNVAEKLAMAAVALALREQPVGVVGGTGVTGLARGMAAEVQRAAEGMYLQRMNRYDDSTAIVSFFKSCA